MHFMRGLVERQLVDLYDVVKTIFCFCSSPTCMCDYYYIDFTTLDTYNM